MKRIFNLSLNASPINNCRNMKDGGAMMAAHLLAQCRRIVDAVLIASLFNEV
jgi:hypothetical protein